MSFNPYTPDGWWERTRMMRYIFAAGVVLGIFIGWFFHGLISMAIMAGYAAFRPSWPLPAIYAVLLAGGFFQSLQFTAYNTIAYADLPAGRMSAATSFYSTFQQVSLSLGITVAAAVLAAGAWPGG